MSNDSNKTPISQSLKLFPLIALAQGTLIWILNKYLRTNDSNHLLTDTLPLFF